MTVDGQGRGDGERREGTEGAGNDEMASGILDDALGMGSGDEIEGDGEQGIAAKGVAGGGGTGGNALGGDEAIGEPTAVFEPEVGVEGFEGALGEIGPAFATAIPRGGAEGSQLAEQPDPEGLDLDGIPFTRRGGGMIGVHPGEVGRTPDETGGVIDTDAIRGAGEITGGDGTKDIGDGAPLVIDDGLVERGLVGGQERGEFLADDSKPERGVGGIAIGGVLAVDGIGQGTVLFETGEGQDQVTDFPDASRGEHATGSDEGIATPIQEPGITGDDGAGVVATDDIGGEGNGEAGTEVVLGGNPGLVQELFDGLGAGRDEVRDGTGIGVMDLCGGDDAGGSAGFQWDVEPTGRPGIAVILHPAGAFDRMGKVFGPFR